MVDPKTPAIRKLYDQYVLLRLLDLRGVDVGLFDFDPDSTLYSFVLNADEQIYLRFGGRDDAGHETYLNLPALQLAMERGLEQHKLAKESKLPKPARAKPRFAGEYPDVKRDTIDKDKCVHCHHMGSGKTRSMQSAGKLDKQADLWVYPEVGPLGITLDAEKGTVIKKADGAAKDAGLKARDEIARVGTVSVLTYGDLQEALDKVPRDAKELKICIWRGKEAMWLTLKLPADWRITKIERRSFAQAVEPFPEFWGKELDKAAKQKLGIRKDEFAVEVTRFWGKTNGQAAGVAVGDVVFEVDGVNKSPYTCNPGLWIKLNRKAGDTVKVKVLRGGKTLEFSFKLKARPW